MFSCEFSKIFQKIITSGRLWRQGITCYEINQANIYFFTVNNENTRTMCEICPKLILKTPERRQWIRSGVFIIDFEQIAHIVLVFPLLTLHKWIPTGNGLNLKIFAKFIGKHLCQSLFFKKVAGMRSLALLKIALAQKFSCEFCEIFKNTFFTEHLRTNASEN